MVQKPKPKSKSKKEKENKKKKRERARKCGSDSYYFVVVCFLKRRCEEMLFKKVAVKVSKTWQLKKHF